MNCVIFYSLSGHSKKIAEEFAAKYSSELIEVKTEKKLGKLGACMVVLLKLFKDNPISIQPFSSPESDAVDVFAPIWAGGVAPPMIAALKRLKKGAKVNLHLVSASGKSASGRIAPLMKELGLDIVGFEDIKAGREH